MMPKIIKMAATIARAITPSPNRCHIERSIDMFIQPRRTTNY